MTTIPSSLLAKSNSTGVKIVNAGDYKEQFDKRLFDLFRQSVNEIKTIYYQGFTVGSAVSHGKDSSAVLLAHLQAFEEYLAENPLVNPSSLPFVVTNIDTGVENPWIAMYSKYERERLESYFADKGWLLEYHSSKPPLSQSWASLFLSANKLFSTPKTNSDCSVILKIDSNQRLIRNLMAKYGESKFVVLLGSRLSESAQRANSIRKFNNDVSVEEALVGSKKGLVYMPIKHWNYDEVMGLLMRASSGDTPVTTPAIGCEIPSYAPEHRMLKLIYGEGSESSCPTSGHKIKGGNQEGGCGRSRFGCGLCLKISNDNSMLHQNKRARYAHIQGNMQKIRDYCAFIASDMDHRTYHARAVDGDMGYVTLQPNVLKASTLEYISFQLMMATQDDANRAETLRALVARAESGEPKALMEDPGYADIMTDPALDIEDREILRQFYLKYATTQVINVFTDAQAIYLDALHSRDGVRLPCFRITFLWEQVKRGARLPYPNVNMALAKADTVPEAKMLPIAKLDLATAHRASEVFEADMRGGCFSQNQDESLTYTLIVKQDGSYNLKFQGKNVYVSKTLKRELALHVESLVNELSTSGELTISKKIALRYRNDVTLAEQINSNGVKAERLQMWSRRQLTKVKRKEGKITRASKGRASVAFYNMNSKPKLERAHVQGVNFWLPSWKRTEYFFQTMDVNEMYDTQIGYSINVDAMEQWANFDGLDRAIETHNKFVQRQLRNKQSRYTYANTNAFEHLVLMGVLEVAVHVKEQCQRICDRTELFSQIGLFHHKDSDRLMALGVSMSEYRQAKFERLLQIRATRNQRRKTIRQQVLNFETDSSSYIKNLVTSLLEKVKTEYSTIAYEHVLYSALSAAGETGFDDVAIEPRLKTTSNWIDDITHATSRVSEFTSAFLNQNIRTAISEDYALTMWLDKTLSEYRVTLTGIMNNHVDVVTTRIQNDVSFCQYWTWMFTERCKSQVSIKAKAITAISALETVNTTNNVIPLEVTKTKSASKLDALLGLAM